MLRRLLAVGIVVVGALSTADAAAADTAPPPGSIAVRLLDAPVNRRDDPRALIYIVDHVAPGTTIQRHIDVSSSAAAPVDVSVYPGGAAITADGFVPAERDAPDELTAWTSLDRSELALTPGAHQPITVTITVPRDAAPGERYAVVWAQVGSGRSATGGIQAVSRVGIRIYLSVGGGNEPASDFTVDSLTASRTAGGQPVVTAQVRNTGGRALDLGGALTLSDGPGGLSAGPFPAQLGTTLAIGGVGNVTIPLDGALPDGPWTAKITLKSGLLTRSAETSLTFPPPGAPGIVSMITGALSWLLGLLGAAALILLIGLGLLLLVRRRNRGHRDGGRHRGSPRDSIHHLLT